MPIKFLYTVIGTRLISSVEIQNFTALHFYDQLLNYVNETGGLTVGAEGQFTFLYDQADTYKIFCIQKSNLSKSHSLERSSTSEI